MTKEAKKNKTAEESKVTPIEPAKTTTKKNTNKSAPKTTTPKPKQLTMAQVKRKAASTRKMEEYELSTGETIRHYPVFSQGKINEMLKEYQDQIQYAVTEDILLPDEKTLDYIYFLCIKHFTSLKKGVTDKYEDQLLQMEHLVDAGYFKEIVNDVFMPSEIDKVLDAITDLLSTYNLLENVQVQINKKTEDLKIKNKDMINVLAQNPYTEVAGKH